VGSAPRSAVSTLASLAAIAGAACTACGCGGSGKHTTTATGKAPAEAGRPSARRAAVAPPTLRATARPLATLPAPIQDAAVARVGGTVYAAGGLTPADTSSAAVSAFPAAGGRSRSLASLPQPVHDGAAAPSGGAAVLFGGGQTEGTDAIVRVAPGAPRSVGRLPKPLSDNGAVAVGRAVYVAGGWDGTTPNTAIYRYTSGGTPHLAAKLPRGLRYAAAATLDGKLLLAGGEDATGAPTRDIWSYDPAGGRVVRAGRLPAPLDHAAAAAVGNRLYVLGGLRGGSPTATILSWAPGEPRAHRAGRLPQPLSDEAAVDVPGGVAVVGGRTASGAVDQVRLLRPQAPRAQARPAAADPAATPLAHGAATAASDPVARLGLRPVPITAHLPGYLMIADRDNNRIIVVSPGKRIVWRFPRRGQSPGQPFEGPDDAFLTPDRRSIITNEEFSDRVAIVSLDRHPRVTWVYGHQGVEGAGRGFLAHPDDAYLVAHDRVMVADIINCRVVWLNRRKHVVRSLGRAGNCTHDPPTGLLQPNGDTPLPDGGVLVTEIGGWVDRFDRRGRLRWSIKTPTDYPSDAQLLPDGNVLVAGFNTPGRVDVLTPKGKVIWTYERSSGAGALDRPSLAVAFPGGKIAVTDDWHHRVVVIDRRTKRIVWQYGHNGTAGRRPGYLSKPDGLQLVR
jgi:hypothetical protein